MIAYVLFFMFAFTFTTAKNSVSLVEPSITSVDNGVLVKILRTVDAVINDEHLLEVTLKLLKGICACMHETIRVKEDDLNLIENEKFLQLEDNNERRSWKEVDLYKRIYETTCLSLKQELTNKIKHPFQKEDKADLSNCGKKFEITTENVIKLSTSEHPILEEKSRLHLENILYRTLIATNKLHKYIIRKHDLFSKAIPFVYDPSKHSIIVILTLYPNQTARFFNKSEQINENELNNALQTNTSIEVDIFDAKYDPKRKFSEEYRKRMDSQCMVRSVYVFLTESEKNNLTNVFKVIRKREMIKIYIEVVTANNHSDYSSVCCKKDNSYNLCRDDITNIGTTTKQKPENLDRNKNMSKFNFKETVLTVLNLVKLFDDELKSKKKTNESVDHMKKHEIPNLAEINHTQSSKIEENLTNVDFYLTNDKISNENSEENPADNKNINIFSNNNETTTHLIGTSDTSTPSEVETLHNKITLTDLFTDNSKTFNIIKEKTIKETIKPVHHITELVTVDNTYDHMRLDDLISSTTRTVNKGLNEDITSSNENAIFQNETTINPYIVIDKISTKSSEREFSLLNTSTKMKNYINNSVLYETHSKHKTFTEKPGSNLLEDMTFTKHAYLFTPTNAENVSRVVALNYLSYLHDAVSKGHDVGTTTEINIDNKEITTVKYVIDSDVNDDIGTYFNNISTIPVMYIAHETNSDILNTLTEEGTTIKEESRTSSASDKNITLKKEIPNLQFENDIAIIKLRNNSSAKLNKTELNKEENSVTTADNFAIRPTEKNSNANATETFTNTLKFVPSSTTIREEDLTTTTEFVSPITEFNNLYKESNIMKSFEVEMSNTNNIIQNYTTSEEIDNETTEPVTKFHLDQNDNQLEHTDLPKPVTLTDTDESPSTTKNNINELINIVSVSNEDNNYYKGGYPVLSTVLNFVDYSALDTSVVQKPHEEVSFINNVKQENTAPWEGKTNKETKYTVPNEEIFESIQLDSKQSNAKLAQTNSKRITSSELNNLNTIKGIQYDTTTDSLTGENNVDIQNNLKPSIFIESQNFHEKRFPIEATTFLDSKFVTKSWTTVLESFNETENNPKALDETILLENNTNELKASIKSKDMLSSTISSKSSTEEEDERVTGTVLKEKSIGKQNNGLGIGNLIKNNHDEFFSSTPSHFITTMNKTDELTTLLLEPSTTTTVNNNILTKQTTKIKTIDDNVTNTSSSTTPVHLKDEDSPVTNLPTITEQNTTDTNKIHKTKMEYASVSNLKDVKNTIVILLETAKETTVTEPQNSTTFTANLININNDIENVERIKNDTEKNEHGKEDVPSKTSTYKGINTYTLDSKDNMEGNELSKPLNYDSEEIRPFNETHKNSNKIGSVNSETVINSDYKINITTSNNKLHTIQSIPNNPEITSINSVTAPIPNLENFAFHNTTERNDNESLITETIDADEFQKETYIKITENHLTHTTDSSSIIKSTHNNEKMRPFLDEVKHIKNNLAFTINNDSLLYDVLENLDHLNTIQINSILTMEPLSTTTINIFSQSEINIDEINSTTTTTTPNIYNDELLINITQGIKELKSTTTVNEESLNEIIESIASKSPESSMTGYSLSTTGTKDSLTKESAINYVSNSIKDELLNITQGIKELKSTTTVYEESSNEIIESIASKSSESSMIAYNLSTTGTKELLTKESATYSINDSIKDSASLTFDNEVEQKLLSAKDVDEMTKSSIITYNLSTIGPKIPISKESTTYHGIITAINDSIDLTPAVAVEQSLHSTEAVDITTASGITNYISTTGSKYSVNEDTSYYDILTPIADITSLFPDIKVKQNLHSIKDVDQPTVSSSIIGSNLITTGSKYSLTEENNTHPRIITSIDENASLNPNIEDVQSFRITKDVDQPSEPSITGNKLSNTEFMTTLTEENPIFPGSIISKTDNASLTPDIEVELNSQSVKSNDQSTKSSFIAYNLSKPGPKGTLFEESTSYPEIITTINDNVSLTPTEVEQSLHSTKDVDSITSGISGYMSTNDSKHSVIIENTTYPGIINTINENASLNPNIEVEESLHIINGVDLPIEFNIIELSTTDFMATPSEKSTSYPRTISSMTDIATTVIKVEQNLQSVNNFEETTNSSITANLSTTESKDTTYLGIINHNANLTPDIETEQSVSSTKDEDSTTISDSTTGSQNSVTEEDTTYPGIITLINENASLNPNIEVEQSLHATKNVDWLTESSTVGFNSITTSPKDALSEKSTTDLGITTSINDITNLTSDIEVKQILYSTKLDQTTEANITAYNLSTTDFMATISEENTTYPADLSINENAILNPDFKVQQNLHITKYINRPTEFSISGYHLNTTEFMASTLTEQSTKNYITSLTPVIEIEQKLQSIKDIDRSTKFSVTGFMTVPKDGVFGKSTSYPGVITSINDSASLTSATKVVQILHSTKGTDRITESSIIGSIEEITTYSGIFTSTNEVTTPTPDIEADQSFDATTESSVTDINLSSIETKDSQTTENTTNPKNITSINENTNLNVDTEDEQRLQSIKDIDRPTESSITDFNSDIIGTKLSLIEENTTYSNISILINDINSLTPNTEDKQSLHNAEDVYQTTENNKLYTNPTVVEIKTMKDLLIPSNVFPITNTSFIKNDELKVHTGEVPTSTERIYNLFASSTADHPEYIATMPEETSIPDISNIINDESMKTSKTITKQTSDVTKYNIASIQKESENLFIDVFATPYNSQTIFTENPYKDNITHAYKANDNITELNGEHSSTSISERNLMKDGNVSSTSVSLTTQKLTNINERIANNVLNNNIFTKNESRPTPYITQSLSDFESIPSEDDAINMWTLGINHPHPNSSVFEETILTGHGIPPSLSSELSIMSQETILTGHGIQAINTSILKENTQTGTLTSPQSTINATNHNVTSEENKISVLLKSKITTLLPVFQISETVTIERPIEALYHPYHNSSKSEKTILTEILTPISSVEHENVYKPNYYTGESVSANEMNLTEHGFTQTIISNTKQDVTQIDNITSKIASNLTNYKGAWENGVKSTTLIHITGAPNHNVTWVDNMINTPVSTINLPILPPVLPISETEANDYSIDATDEWTDQELILTGHGISKSKLSNKYETIIKSYDHTEESLSSNDVILTERGVLNTKQNVMLVDSTTPKVPNFNETLLDISKLTTLKHNSNVINHNITGFENTTITPICTMENVTTSRDLLISETVASKDPNKVINKFGKNLANKSSLKQYNTSVKLNSIKESTASVNNNFILNNYQEISNDESFTVSASEKEKNVTNKNKYSEKAKFTEQTTIGDNTESPDNKLETNDNTQKDSSVTPINFSDKKTTLAVKNNRNTTMKDSNIFYIPWFYNANLSKFEFGRLSDGSMKTPTSFKNHIFELFKNASKVIQNMTNDNYLQTASIATNENINYENGISNNTEQQSKNSSLQITPSYHNFDISNPSPTSTPRIYVAIKDDIAVLDKNKQTFPTTDHGNRFVDFNTTHQGTPPLSYNESTRSSTMTTSSDTNIKSTGSNSETTSYTLTFTNKMEHNLYTDNNTMKGKTTHEYYNNYSKSTFHIDVNNTEDMPKNTTSDVLKSNVAKAYTQKEHKTVIANKYLTRSTTESKTSEFLSSVTSSTKVTTAVSGQFSNNITTINGTQTADKDFSDIDNKIKLQGNKITDDILETETDTNIEKYFKTKDPFDVKSDITISENNKTMTHHNISSVDEFNVACIKTNKTDAIPLKQNVEEDSTTDEITQSTTFNKKSTLPHKLETNDNTQKDSSVTPINFSDKKTTLAVKNNRNTTMKGSNIFYIPWFYNANLSKFEFGRLSDGSMKTPTSFKNHIFELFKNASKVIQNMTNDNYLQTASIATNENINYENGISNNTEQQSKNSSLQITPSYHNFDISNPSPTSTPRIYVAIKDDIAVLDKIKQTFPTNDHGNRFVDFNTTHQGTPPLSYNKSTRSSTMTTSSDTDIKSTGSNSETTSYTLEHNLYTDNNTMKGKTTHEYNNYSKSTFHIDVNNTEDMPKSTTSDVLKSNVAKAYTQKEHKAVIANKYLTTSTTESKTSEFWPSTLSSVTSSTKVTTAVSGQFSNNITTINGTQTADKDFSDLDNKIKIQGDKITDEILETETDTNIEKYFKTKDPFDVKSDITISENNKTMTRHNISSVDEFNVACINTNKTDAIPLKQNVEEDSTTDEITQSTTFNKKSTLPHNSTTSSSNIKLINYFGIESDIENEFISKNSVNSSEEEASNVGELENKLKAIDSQNNNQPKASNKIILNNTNQEKKIILPAHLITDSNNLLLIPLTNEVTNKLPNPENEDINLIVNQEIMEVLQSASNRPTLNTIYSTINSIYNDENKLMKKIKPTQRTLFPESTKINNINYLKYLHETLPPNTTQIVSQNREITRKYNTESYSSKIIFKGKNIEIPADTENVIKIATINVPVQDNGLLISTAPTTLAVQLNKNTRENIYRSKKKGFHRIIFTYRPRKTRSTTAMIPEMTTKKFEIVYNTYRPSPDFDDMDLPPILRPPVDLLNVPSYDVPLLLARILFANLRDNNTTLIQKTSILPVFYPATRAISLKTKKPYDTRSHKFKRTTNWPLTLLINKFNSTRAMHSNNIKLTTNLPSHVTKRSKHKKYNDKLKTLPVTFAQPLVTLPVNNITKSKSTKKIHYPKGNYTKSNSTATKLKLLNIFESYVTRPITLSNSEKSTQNHNKNANSPVTPLVTFPLSSTKPNPTAISLKLHEISESFVSRPIILSNIEKSTKNPQKNTSLINFNSENAIQDTQIIETPETNTTEDVPIAVPNSVALETSTEISSKNSLAVDYISESFVTYPITMFSVKESTQNPNVIKFNLKNVFHNTTPPYITLSALETTKTKITNVLLSNVEKSTQNPQKTTNLINFISENVIQNTQAIETPETSKTEDVPTAVPNSVTLETSTEISSKNSLAVDPITNPSSIGTKYNYVTGPIILSSVEESTQNPEKNLILMNFNSENVIRNTQTSETPETSRTEDVPTETPNQISSKNSLAVDYISESLVSRPIILSSVKESTQNPEKNLILMTTQISSKNSLAIDPIILSSAKNSTQSSQKNPNLINFNSENAIQDTQIIETPETNTTEDVPIAVPNSVTSETSTEIYSKNSLAIDPIILSSVEESTQNPEKNLILMNFNSENAIQDTQIIETPETNTTEDVPIAVPNSHNSETSTEISSKNSLAIDPIILSSVEESTQNPEKNLILINFNSENAIQDTQIIETPETNTTEDVPIAVPNSVTSETSTEISSKNSLAIDPIILSSVEESSQYPQKNANLIDFNSKNVIQNTLTIETPQTSTTENVPTAVPNSVTLETSSEISSKNSLAVDSVTNPISIGTKYNYVTGPIILSSVEESTQNPEKNLILMNFNAENAIQDTQIIETPETNITEDVPIAVPNSVTSETSIEISSENSLATDPIILSSVEESSQNPQKNPNLIDFNSENVIQNTLTVETPQTSTTEDVPTAVPNSVTLETSSEISSKNSLAVDPVTNPISIGTKYNYVTGPIILSSIEESTQNPEKNLILINFNSENVIQNTQTTETTETSTSEDVPTAVTNSVTSETLNEISSKNSLAIDPITPPTILSSAEESTQNPQKNLNVTKLNFPGRLVSPLVTLPVDNTEPKPNLSVFFTNPTALLQNISESSVTLPIILSNVEKSTQNPDVPEFNSENVVQYIMSPFSALETTNTKTTIGPNLVTLKTSSEFSSKNSLVTDRITNPSSIETKYNTSPKPIITSNKLKGADNTTNNTSDCAIISQIVHKTINELRAMLQKANCTIFSPDNNEKNMPVDNIDPFDNNNDNKNTSEENLSNKYLQLSSDLNNYISIETKKLTPFLKKHDTLLQISNILKNNFQRESNTLDSNKLKANDVNYANNVNNLIKTFNDSVTNIKSLNSKEYINKTTNEKTIIRNHGKSPIVMWPVKDYQLRLSAMKQNNSSKALGEDSQTKPINFLNHATLINKINNLNVKINLGNNDEIENLIKRIHNSTESKTFDNKGKTTLINTLKISQKTTERNVLRKKLKSSTIRRKPKINYLQNTKKSTILPKSIHPVMVMKTLKHQPKIDRLVALKPPIIDIVKSKKKLTVDKIVDLKPPILEVVVNKANTGHINIDRIMYPRKNKLMHYNPIPLEKTKLYPVNTPQKAGKPSIQTIRVGSNIKKVVTMNTNDFFSHRRKATKKPNTININIANRRFYRPESPYDLHFPVQKALITRPAFRSIDPYKSFLPQTYYRKRPKVTYDKYLSMPLIRSRYLEPQITRHPVMENKYFLEYSLNHYESKERTTQRAMRHSPRTIFFLSPTLPYK